MSIDHFGDDVAPTYDLTHAEAFAPATLEPAVDTLAALAGDGRALEFAIGTGRVALPLAARGVEVHGIERSPAMVAQLRAKPGGDRVPVVVGDMASTTVPGAFRLVYLVFNTIANLTTQDEQVACFRNAAAHLEPGGCFVVELFVPQLQRLPAGEAFRPFEVTPEHLGIDEYDVAEQLLWSHHYRRGDDGRYGRWTIPFRYAWPAELDLMARLAGLRLRSRAADWRGAPFTSASTSHVSVWEKPAA